MTRIFFFKDFKQTVLALVMLTIFVGLDGAMAHGTKDKTLISPTELTAERSRFQVIDIRSQLEFEAAHVPGAVVLPLADISERNLKSLGIVTEKPVVLYAVSESGAKKGRMLLDILGFKTVRVLAGGFTHYLEDGQPIETGLVKKLAVTGSSVKPDISVNPEHYDFGIIDQMGGIVSTTFKIKNNSNRKIIITEITTSCGCTTAEMTVKTIPAGEARTLKVYFDPNFHKEPEGKFSRTVFLQTTEGFEIQAKIEVTIAI